MIFLGAGFGLLSTPTIVGIQSVVDWNRRGVVTGANQFGRYLGQSLGAAIFGAVFNASYTKELTKADFKISENVENVSDILQSPDLSESAKTFIKQALNTSNHHIFYGMIIFACLTFAAVLFLVPRRLNKFEG